MTTPTKAENPSAGMPGLTQVQREWLRCELERTRCRIAFLEGQESILADALLAHGASSYDPCR